MNATMGQSQFDIVHNTVKERMRFLNFKHNIAETGSRFTYISNIFHKDSITDLRKSTGHIGTMRVEQALSLVLVLDP